MNVPTSKRSMAHAFAAAASARGPADGPKISIVIPAYNDEGYVARSVGSCLHQTYARVEIICVDDGSSDGTLAALQEFVKADEQSRVLVVALEENSGPHNARRAGLAQASGDIVCFLDADDELARSACAKIAAAFAQEPCDIVHFAARVQREGGVSLQQALDMQEWMKPVEGSLVGREILDRSFVQLGYSFSVCGKAFRAEVARRAFDALGSRSSDFGEDALAYFAIGYFSKSYRGMPHERLYVYHLGDGLSGRSGIDAAEFSRSLRGIASVEGMRDFLASEGALEECGYLYEAHRAHQLQALLRGAVTDVREADRAEVIGKILELWPLDEVVQEACSLGTPAVELLKECVGEDLHLTERQTYACGVADGQQKTRAEFESSASYRLGRFLTSIPRTARAKLIR